MGDGSSTPETADSSPPKAKTEGGRLLRFVPNRLREVLGRREPHGITPLNATANSYVTPEMEDQKLLEQYAQVEPAEKELASLQGEIQRSTFLTLDSFPPEFREALIEDTKQFNLFMDKLRRGEYIDRVPRNLLNVLGPHISSPTGTGALRAHPKEYLLASIKKARELLGYYPKHHDIGECIKDLRAQLNGESSSVKAVEELKQPERYLSHGVAHEGIQSIFQSGYIGSRQSQLDRYGKTHIATSGTHARVVEYPDYFDLDYKDNSAMNHRVIKADFHQSAEGYILNTRSKRERYELLVLDGVYYGLGVINFVFPEAEILQVSSFFASDGLHVFNKNYDTKNNRQGYEVSLRDTSHFVVTSTENKDRVLKFIEQADWIEDKEAYIRDNVVFLDEKGLNSQQINERVRELSRGKFADLNYPNFGSHVVPTGTVLDSEEAVNGAQLFKLV
ncbi:hypothetical protein A3A14_01375 [Candidatus Daviesbacteria bacterium RIFCSPLOWO2_01_FULL_43_38]|uniref:Uncharacterized protein n=2 Tax=Candidatus Daviesiibacteriota TaxID=1752718 RepID=A0A1F5K7G7_9BACT|nr:MAG: hypothetical protein UV41_C0010G0028 [Candidatus Daviesbacteria bacterium GW2011_GWA2_42_7]OGE18973.1 MAG: hypothetical protein A2874_02340 [Candidatus Daviesbacteria bacterium RIFCSPHIGHO2_01_FULL_43_17]OGE36882.1 MAG: hypothetical protein A3E45_03500 [Candidatus Daviesbacteria bacterium RIFCSPHIGHO2_12_FULL_43_11]OGE63308.1 MAG: hypothetical protein A3A14_01375 [Candidatus Daviesbacteria bacterium RIFCSPLOWO2_01_FULL_43_38]OGE70876.1 MAG: hypothetical protein A3J21_00115 [Candidatus D